jgi:cytochrome c oxidase cbb3-type subunit 3
VEGREAYLERCVSCHGPNGRGDGPIAKGLSGPPPRDFSGAWRHGERPEEVLRVVAKGVEGTAMPGWAGTFTDRQVRAVSAYTYYLGGRRVPDALRKADDRSG